MGSNVGRYEILRELGVGGMAEVLLGRTTGEGGFEKLCAIKRILPHMTANESFVKMFIDEARISARLNHSSIGQIFEFGKSGGRYFIAMEYIQGLDLRAIHRHFRQAETHCPQAMAAFIMGQVCSALSYAHTRTDSQGQPLNIVHRDLSPSNVLVSYTGEVKLIDFGIAKAAERLYVTVGPNLKGKYAYMSPEQAFGQPVDQRSDIFGIAVLLFELLTGRNPFRAKSELETLQRVQAARVPPPSKVVQGISPELDAVCLKGMAQKPEDRYQTAEEMLLALEDFGRRHPYSSRHMARFMREAFQAERDKERDLLRAAREAAQAGQVEVVSADELSELFSPQGGGIDGLGQVRATAPMAALVVPGGTPSGVGQALTPSGVGQALTPSGVVPILAHEPGRPRPGTSASPEPLPAPMGPAEPAFAALPEAGPLLLGSHSQPIRRKSNLGLHALIFTIIVVAVGGGAYFLFRDTLQNMRKGEPRKGSVQIVVPTPAPAEILLNDAPMAQLPGDGRYLVPDLLPGKHRITLRGAGLMPLTRVVDVQEGETLTVELELQRAAPDAGPPDQGRETRPTKTGKKRSFSKKSK